MISTFYTVGHSTRTMDDFITLMKTYKIEIVVDVRKIAGSSYNSQYNQKSLDKSLERKGISYMRLEKLGGLRHTTNESVKLGWENLSFRGYADYMQTKEFEDGLDTLIKIGQKKQVAIMCAEAVPWRCHRSLIADALLVRGFIVMDIFSQTSCKPHKLTKFAQVSGYDIIYPKAEDKS